MEHTTSDPDDESYWASRRADRLMNHTLAFALRDALMAQVQANDLDVPQSLEVLRHFTRLMLRDAREHFIEADIAHADGRLWQWVSALCHELAHAPDAAPDDADLWMSEAGGPHDTGP
jgi:hypothetical protein